MRALVSVLDQAYCWLCSPKRFDTGRDSPSVSKIFTFGSITRPEPDLKWLINKAEIPQA